jgi:hypothetical protein
MLEAWYEIGAKSHLRKLVVHLRAHAVIRNILDGRVVENIFRGRRRPTWEHRPDWHGSAVFVALRRETAHREITGRLQHRIELGREVELDVADSAIRRRRDPKSHGAVDDFHPHRGGSGAALTRCESYS